MFAFKVFWEVCEPRRPDHLEEVASRHQEGDPLVAGHRHPASDAVAESFAMNPVDPHRWIQHRTLENLHDFADVHPSQLLALLNQQVVREHDLLHHLVEDANHVHEILLADLRLLRLFLAALCLLLPLGLRGGGEHGLQVRLLQDGLIGLKIGLDGAFGNCTTTSRFHCVVEVVGLPTLRLDADSQFRSHLHSEALVQCESAVQCQLTGLASRSQGLSKCQILALGLRCQGCQLRGHVLHHLGILGYLCAELLGFHLHCGDCAVRGLYCGLDDLKPLLGFLSLADFSSIRLLHHGLGHGLR
mmetsp:Transcript_113650/g.270655  ORF Transcript_113650/g.270655 Transcript_113650/m.270655 type:complete len:301 (+) Transcript_113650:366-1268(+)